MNLILNHIHVCMFVQSELFAAMEVVDDVRPACEFSDDDLVKLLRQRWEDARKNNGGMIAQDKGDLIMRSQLYARVVSFLFSIRLYIPLSGAALPAVQNSTKQEKLHQFIGA